MAARSGVGAAAVAELKFARLEVLLKLGPFLVGWLTVFLGWTNRTARVKESAVGADQIVVEDGGIALRGREPVVPENLGSDMNGQPAGDHLGGEHPAEVVGSGLDRLAGGVTDTGTRPGIREQLVDHARVDHERAVVAAALEQVRQWRSPDPFVGVVPGHQRHRCTADGAEAGDDRRERAGQLRRHNQQPFLVRLGRHDLQQRDDLTGIGQPMADQREHGEFEQFLDPNSGMAEYLDDRPRPERFVLAMRDVDALTGCDDLDPHQGRSAAAHGAEFIDTQRQTPIPDPVMGELCVGFDSLSRRKQPGLHGKIGLGRIYEPHQVWQPITDALMHPGPHPPLVFHVALGVTAPHRTRHRPGRPRRVLERPLRDIEVEGPHRDEDVQRGEPLADSSVSLDHGSNSLPPGFGDVLGQVQRVDAGMVRFQVRPERGEDTGVCGEGAVVQRRAPLVHVAHDHVADWLAEQVVAIDDLTRRQLAA
jgi:hypothetical protein